MIRFLFKLILCVMLALAAGFVYLAVVSGDPIYTVYEWMSPARFQQYDRLIRVVAVEHHLDPMLVKAVVWRESRFDPNKYGSRGERGLMQVTEKAANEWARENKIADFHVDQLFDPKTNLEAGTWYLRRAVEHWKLQSDPVPFALAEYNAGASRAQRWSKAALPKHRRGRFSRTSIFPQRGSTSSQSSIAINSINGVVGCDEKLCRESRAALQRRRRRNSG